MHATLNDCPGGMTRAPLSMLLEPRHRGSFFLPLASITRPAAAPFSRTAPLLRATQRMSRFPEYPFSKFFWGFSERAEAALVLITHRRKAQQPDVPRTSRADGKERATYWGGSVSRRTDKIHARKDSADQESSRTREKPRGDRRTNRRHSWLPASHLLQAWN